MSWLAVSCAISLVACVNQSQSSHEGPSLIGPIACVTTTCGDGEICMNTELDGSGGSADPIEHYSCVMPAAGCSLFACSYSCRDRQGPSCCPSCIADLCGAWIPSLSGVLITTSLSRFA
jgi:hypothetical protein